MLVSGNEESLRQLLQSSKKVLSISHKMDVDGVCSAALVKKAFPESVLIFSDHERGTLSETLKLTGQMLERERFDLAIIADISFNDDSLEAMEGVVKTLKGHGCKVVYLDHHPVTENGKAMLSKYADFAVAGEDADNCGTTLVYRFIFLNRFKEDRNAHKLEILAAIADFGLFSEQELAGTPISDMIEAIMYQSISTNNMDESNAMLNRIVDELASQEVLDLSKTEYAKNLSGMYKKEVASRILEMQQNSFYFDLGGIKVSLGAILDTNRELDSQSVCSKLKEGYPDSNLEIYIKKTGIRMRSQGIDTLPLARSFGGNGHPGASGFNNDFKEFNHLDTKEDLNNLVGFIIGKIKELYMDDKKET